MWKKWEEPQLLSVFSPAEWGEGGGAVKAGTLRIIPQAKVPSPDIMLMSMPMAHSLSPYLSLAFLKI
jgi:hypothetical protein